MLLIIWMKSIESLKCKFLCISTSKKKRKKDWNCWWCQIGTANPLKYRTLWLFFRKMKYKRFDNDEKCPATKNYVRASFLWYSQFLCGFRSLELINEAHTVLVSPNRRMISFLLILQCSKSVCYGYFHFCWLKNCMDESRISIHTASDWYHVVKSKLFNKNTQSAHSGRPCMRFICLFHKISWIS